MSLDLVFFANGFLYEGSKQELYAESKGKRWTTSIDMQAITSNTTGVSGFAVGSLKELLTELVKQLVSNNEMISRLRIMGHSDGEILVFEGRYDSLNLGFDFVKLNEQITSDTLKLHKGTIDKYIKGKFTKDAEIILYGCNSGNYQEGNLSQNVANAFEVPTRGFKFPIEACIKIETFKDKKGKIVDYEIKSRGWFREVKGQSGNFKKNKPCEQQGFVSNLNELARAPTNLWRPKITKNKP